MVSKLQSGQWTPTWVMHMAVRRGEVGHKAKCRKGHYIPMASRGTKCAQERAGGSLSLSGFAKD